MLLTRAGKVNGFNGNVPVTYVNKFNAVEAVNGLRDAKTVNHGFA